MPTSPNWFGQGEQSPFPWMNPGRGLLSTPAWNQTPLPPIDPTYQYSPGNTNIKNDLAQFNARMAAATNIKQGGDVLREWGKTHHSGGGPGLFGRIGNAVGNFAGGAAGAAKGLVTQGPGTALGGAKDWASHFFGTPEGRKQLAIVAAAGLGSMAAGGSFGGAAGAGGGGLGAGASAATVDPFAAGAGLGTSWAPIAGGAGAAGLGVPAAAGAVSPATAGGAGFPWVNGISAPATAAGTTAAVAAPTAAAPWYNSFAGQTAISSGLNLFSGFLQNLAIQKAQGASDAAIKKRIQQALAILTPEHIMALAQQFLPQMGANANAAGQTAIQAVREQAARTGQLEGPRALSFEAGTRAKLANEVQQNAFNAAFNTAGGQASALTSMPFTPIQPQTGIAQAIIDSVNQAYYVKARGQQPPPYNPYSPYGVPYQWPGANGRIG